MLNVEISYDPGFTLGLSAQRRADQRYFDFTPGVADFTVPPGKLPALGPTLTTPMAEEAGLFRGLYTLSYGPTPGSIWWDGDILVGVHVLAVPPGGDPSLVSTCVLRFPVPFAHGDSLYVPPPFYSY